MLDVEVREYPKGKYAVRVFGWVRSNEFSRVRCGWVSKCQGVCTMVYFSSRPTHLSEYSSMPVFNIFELLQNAAFADDKIEM